MRSWTKEEVESFLAPEDKVMVRVIGSQVKTHEDLEVLILASSRIEAERVECRNWDSVEMFCRELFVLARSNFTFVSGRLSFCGTDQRDVDRKFGEIEQKYKAEKKCHSDDNGFYCYCDEQDVELTTDKG